MVCPVKDTDESLHSRGWDGYKKEDGHYWINSYINRHGLKEFCLACFATRDVS